MDEYHFSVHLCDNQQEIEATQEGLMAILDGLGRNIIENLGNVELGKSIRILLRNGEDRVVGGIVGNVFGGWLYIELMWVEETLRNLGYGTELLRLLEREAARQGCRYAHTDTYSFEARPFYEKSGYEVFASLEEYPPGHSKHFLKKKLIGE